MTARLPTLGAGALLFLLSVLALPCDVAPLSAQTAALELRFATLPSCFAKLPVL